MTYDEKNQNIETERLLLRLFNENDACDVEKLCNNFEVYKSTLSLPYPYPIECALSWISNHKDNFATDKSYELAITDRETGVLYGCIGLSNNQQNRNGEAGYWIGKAYWGNGYATEALSAIVSFAFSHKNYHKIYARHFESNPASGRVMQKVGMNYEGKQPDHIYKENKYETIILYGIVNPA